MPNCSRFQARLTVVKGPNALTFMVSPSENCLVYDIDSRLTRLRSSCPLNYFQHGIDVLALEFLLHSVNLAPLSLNLRLKIFNTTLSALVKKACLTQTLDRFF